MKSGFVTIIGRTNAGKSTLLNQILKKKVSIATYKPQTTRNAIQGIYNDNESQIIFIDTPGVLSPHHELDTYMNKEALTSLSDVEAVIYLIDASTKYNEASVLEMKSRLSTLKIPLFIVLNKIDLATITHMEEIKKIYHEHFPNSKLIEISALDGFNVDYLVNEIKNVLEEGVQYYGKFTVSNHPLTFLFSELIREQLLLNLDKEVPHSCAVKIDSIENNASFANVYAKIIVERASQKSIVIGKHGSMIKKIGEKARKQMESIINKKVNLSLFVAIEEDWRNSSRILKEFGYDD